jgi:hypothetical protein
MNQAFKIEEGKVTRVNFHNGSEQITFFLESPVKINRRDIVYSGFNPKTEEAYLYVLKYRSRWIRIYSFKSGEKQSVRIVAKEKAKVEQKGLGK